MLSNTLSRPYFRYTGVTGDTFGVDGVDFQSLAACGSHIDLGRF